jgi:hypothetical protein
MEYLILRSFFCEKSNTFIQHNVYSGDKQNCLEVFDFYTELAEANKVFFVNEEIVGQTIVREFATIKKGYVYSLIFVAKNNIISFISTKPQSNEQNKS